MSKKISLKYMLTAVGFMLCLIGVLLTWAYFEDMGGGVRPTGMGEAFVAVADDINAMQYNSAGLSRLEQVEIAGMYSALYTNLDLRLYNQDHDYLGYNLLAATVPIQELRGGVGLTWKQFNTEFYQENIVMLGYGRKMWTWGATPSEGGAIDLGCNAKWLEWQVGANQFTTDPEYYPYSSLQKNAFSADLGLMVRLYSNWKVGFSAENIVPANVGLTTTEDVPAIFRLGAAYNLYLGSAYADSLLSTLEVTKQNQEYTPKVGLESWHFHRSVAIRAGANTDDFSCGLSYRYVWNSADLALQLDYAFTYPWHLADTMGSHWVGMTISWDMFNPREAEKGQELERRTRSALRAKGIALEAAQASAQALADAQAAAKANSLEAYAKIKEAADKSMSTAETAKLAAEVVQAAATESKNNTLTAMAVEASSASTAASVAVQQIQILLAAAVPLVSSQPPVTASEPVHEIPRLPEKYSDRIVVGIQTKVITDFGSIQDMEPLLQKLSASLQKTVGMKLEWRLLSPANTAGAASKRIGWRGGV